MDLEHTFTFNLQVALEVPNHGHEYEQLVDPAEQAPSGTVFQELSGKHESDETE